LPRIFSPARIIGGCDRLASRNEPDVPSFYGDDALAGWKGVIDAVHGAGGRMGPQLWHTGAVKNPHLD